MYSTPSVPEGRKFTLSLDDLLQKECTGLISTCPVSPLLLYSLYTVFTNLPDQRHMHCEAWAELHRDGEFQVACDMISAVIRLQVCAIVQNKLHSYDLALSQLRLC